MMSWNASKERDERRAEERLNPRADAESGMSGFLMRFGGKPKQRSKKKKKRNDHQ